MNLLTFEVHQSAAIVSVVLRGRLTLGPQLRNFSDRLTALIGSRSASTLVLEVDELSDIDSAGLGELVILLTLCNERNWRMGLLGPTRRILGILESTRLLDLFPHFPDRASAAGWLTGLPHDQHTG